MWFMLEYMWFMWYMWFMLEYKVLYVCKCCNLLKRLIYMYGPGIPPRAL